MPVGVLALQGAVEPHVLKFRSCGAECIEVRSAEDLARVDRLVMPGGESSTMLKLAQRFELWEPLAAFARSKPVWGICAGSILLAREVQHPQQASLGVMDIRATRNFYGSQRESFKAQVEIPLLSAKIPVDFIRAPLLEPLGSGVEVLASLNEQSVLMRQGRCLASSFHVELGESEVLHRFFLAL